MKTFAQNLSAHSKHYNTPPHTHTHTYTHTHTHTFIYTQPPTQNTHTHTHTHKQTNTALTYTDMGSKRIRNKLFQTPPPPPTFIIPLNINTNARDFSTEGNYCVSILFFLHQCTTEYYTNWLFDHQGLLKCLQRIIIVLGIFLLLLFSDLGRKIYTTSKVLKPHLHTLSRSRNYWLDGFD